MTLNILTSGLITPKFGIRPALMCATRKDLSKHSVVRIASDNASGWIGIANGNLITGAKCQAGDETLSGFEALALFMKLDTGVFDLIQMDSRLLGDELAQSIGINIDELLDQLKASSAESSTIEILRKCKRIDLVELASEPILPPPISASGEYESVSGDLADEDWDLGDEGVIESLERQTRRKKTNEEEVLVFSNDNAMNALLDSDSTQESLLADAPSEEESIAAASAYINGVETSTAQETAKSPAKDASEPVPEPVPEPEKKVSFLDSLAAAWGKKPTAEVKKATAEAKKLTAEAKKATEEAKKANAEAKKATAELNKASDEANKTAAPETAKPAEPTKPSTKEEIVPAAKITWEPTESVPVKRVPEPSSEISVAETVIVKRNKPTIELTPVAKRKTAEAALPSKPGDAPSAPAKENLETTGAGPSAESQAESTSTAEPGAKSDTQENSDSPSGSDAAPRAARMSGQTSTAEIAIRFGQLANAQEAAFDVTTMDDVEEDKREGGFIIVSQEEQQEHEAAIREAKEAAARKMAESRRKAEQAPAEKDLLGTALRAELQEFVKQKFGVEDNKPFEQVKLEDSKDYQQSLVLRDLENAIGRSRGEEEIPLPPKPTPRPDSVEIRPMEQSGQSTLQKMKSHAMTQSMQAQQRPKSGAINATGQGSQSKEDERESSRNIFVEQVRKSIDIDARSFVSTQVEDKKLELSILKDKRIRNILVVGASVCIVFAGAMFVFFSAQRQSSLEAASEKLLAGDNKGAKEAYDAIIASNPLNWEAYLGHALASKDDYKTQVADFKKVLSIRPREFSAATGLTKAYFELKQYDKAVESADFALKLKPNVSSFLIKSDSLMKLGRYDQAANVLNEALAIAETNKGNLYHQLSICYSNTKDYAKQADSLNKAITDEPKNSTYMKELAILKISQGENLRGKELLDKAIAISPGDGELHYHNALLIKQKEPDNAIEELTKAIEHGYAKQEAFGERGLLYYQKKDYGPAKADLEEALEMKPDEKLQKALDLTDKAIQIAKTRTGPRILAEANTETPLSAKDLEGDYVGRAYEQLRAGNGAYAIRLLRAAVRSNASDTRARRYLAHALYSEGDYVGSSTQFAYAAAGGLTAEEQFMYGRALNKASRLESAIKVLQNLVAQQPGYTKARAELIKAYTLAGFSDHAREECQIGMQQARNQQEYMEFKSLMP